MHMGRGQARRHWVGRDTLWLGSLLLHTSVALQIWPVAALPRSALSALRPTLRGVGARVATAATRGESPGGAGGGGGTSEGFLWQWRKREIGNILRFSLPALSIPLAVSRVAQTTDISHTRPRAASLRPLPPACGLVRAPCPQAHTHIEG